MGTKFAVGNDARASPDLPGTAPPDMPGDGRLPGEHVVDEDVQCQKRAKYVSEGLGARRSMWLLNTHTMRSNPGILRGRGRLSISVDGGRVKVHDGHVTDVAHVAVNPDLAFWKPSRHEAAAARSHRGCRRFSRWR